MFKLAKLSVIAVSLLFVVPAAAKKSKEAQFVVKQGYKSVVYGGITYKGSIAVPEAAFKRARYVVDFMLEKVPYIRTRLTEVGYKIVIMAQGQRLTDLPEYEYFKGKKAHQATIGLSRSYDTEVPGMAEYELLVVQEKILTLGWFAEDTMAHEMAHAILFHMYKEDADTIQSIYKNAFEKRFFPTRTYLMNNYQEYWAVLSAAWLGVSKNFPGNGGAETPEKIKARDPKMAAFLEQVYGLRSLDPVTAQSGQ